MENKKSLIKFNIIAILAIAIFAVAISPVSLQNDTFYTIKIGEYILQNGIDMQDPFSWHENLSYTYPHWAYDVFIFLIYSGFGMFGIYVSTCVLAAVLGIVLYRVNCKLAKNHIISFVITLISLYIVKDYIAARAQLVTFILFVLAIYCIEKFLSTKKIRYGLGLVIIATIIANMHAAVWPFLFVLFIPYIAEYIVALVTDFIMEEKIKLFLLNRKILKLSKKEENKEKVELLQEKVETLKVQIKRAKENRAMHKANSYKINIEKNNNVKWLIVVMLICTLTGLLTPIGDTPYTYLIKTMQGTTTESINEHLPMTLIDHENIIILLLLYLVLLTFTKSKIQLRDLFMLAGLIALMFYSRRQLTMVVLIGSVILNKLIISVIENNLKISIDNFIKNVATKFGAFVVLGVVLATSIYLWGENKGKEYINSSTYPVYACDYILENLDIENIKLYNDYNYGSYLIFRGIPVFIDSRADLYAPEFNTLTGDVEDGQDIFSDFLNISGIAVYYDDMFEYYSITHVLTTANSKLSMLIDKREDDKYEQLYEDDNFVLYKIND